MSDQSSFWVSEKTKTWPYPSRPSGSFACAILSSSGSLKNSAMSLFTSRITSSGTPWLTSFIHSYRYHRCPFVRRRLTSTRFTTIFGS
jgi:hypothetical protein